MARELQQIIHHDEFRDRTGKVIQEAWDEEIYKEEDPELELLRECILELADIVYGQMESED